MSSSTKFRYCYNVGEDWSGQWGHPAEAPMKKLINDEMAWKPSTRQNVPSIVARLMGVDVLPPEAKSAVHPIKKRDETIGNNKLNNNEENVRGSMPHQRVSSRQQFDPIYSDADRWSSSQNVEKPKRREHPQEEELQKFKKDFEAWQAARFKECYETIGNNKLNNSEGNVRGSMPHQRVSSRQQFDPIYCDADRWSSSQNVEKPKRREHPQEEELQKFKKEFEAWQAARFKECSRFAQVEEDSNFSLKAKAKRYSAEAKSLEKGHSCRCREKQKESSLLISSRAKGREVKRFGATVSGEKAEHQNVPATIVLLKPGPDRIWSSDDSWTSFSGSSEERGSIEDFLEEVKERLKRELQGKSLNFREISPEPRQTARRVRETAGLIRSDSTRSYICSPESIDARRFLAERLRNVLGNERQPGMKHLRRPSYWEIVKDEEIQARSFRHDKELSPKNLVRSLSAPVSGTSFRKLLLEDRHVVTGAHIRRKHESIENLLLDARKERKERFSFRERVHNFRSTFSIRGRLFRRRMHSVEELRFEPNFMKDIMSGPTVISNPNEIYENSTEVPPSPASVCSSVQEEFWRPSNDLSPLSSPDTSPADIIDVDADASPDFAEINSASSELQIRQQPNQPQSNITLEITSKHEPFESKETKLEDEALSFIRALLVASGIYGGSSHSNLLWKMINDSVFEEVEESYEERAKETDYLINDSNEDGEIDHKVLRDLLNEALFSVLRPPLIFPTKASGSDCSPRPHGEELLDRVWGIIRAYAELPHDDSLDDVVARDMESTPWSRSLDAQVSSIVGEIEGMILEDIVEEIVKGIN